MQTVQHAGAYGNLRCTYNQSNNSFQNETFYNISFKVTDDTLV